MLNQLADRVGAVSAAMMTYVMRELAPDQMLLIEGGTGLPANVVDSVANNLTICATPVTEPLFRQPMLRFAEATRRDLLIVRHGFHPETLDPVLVDVVARTHCGPILVEDMIFWRAPSGALHLVPSKPNLYASLGHHGLEVSLTPPWDTWPQRSAGLERAAAEIVRMLRN